MKKIHLFSLLVIVFVGICSFDWSKKATEILPEEIRATSYALTAPVLKGLIANPVLRIAVSIPEGNTEQHYRKLHCTINAAAINNIQKVDVYLTGAEPFSTSNLVASMDPSSLSFSIPVNLNFNPGIQFIWFSIVLKNDADIKSKIELYCTKIINENGKELIIKKDNSNYTRRTGVAIRKAGDDGVNTYRIPGIVQTNKGTLIAVYDIRYNDSRDLPGNIDVGMSRSTDNGKSWEPMKVIMDMGAPHENNGIGDPAILFDPVTRKIFVASLWR